jgi:hypothetical protein
MNISDFTYILQNPAHINASQTKAIAAIIREFPYFQAAHIVHLKGLKNQDSFKYNQNLKTAAAYTTDRSILFEFITSETFEQHEISSAIKEAHESPNEVDVDVDEITIDVEEVKIDPNLRMEDAIKTKIQEANAILDPDLFQPKIVETPISVIKTVEASEEEINETPEETLQLGKPLSFEKKEKHSFSEWLQLTSFKPIDRTVKQEEKIVNSVPEVSNFVETETEKTKKFALINKFIASNPKIKPVQTKEKIINLADASTVDQSMLMTETLAKVYLEQKKYKKAIKAYDILILKYPEKSGFFADQIRAIKKLQKNN